MFKNMKIRTKILIAFTTVAILAVGLVGFFAFTTGSSTLEEESFNKLTAVREMKASQIEEYFQLVENQVITLSENRMIIEAMREFDDGLHNVERDLGITEFEQNFIDARLNDYYEEEFLPRLIPNLLKDVSVDDFWPDDTKTRVIQDLYISSNPFEVGSKHLLDNAGDGSSYSQSHEIYHPILREYLEHFGYYDIFLVDVDTGGHIAYSVFKEVDFGTSLLNGPYADTNFADAYNAARAAGDKDFVKVVDFEPYAPSYNAPAAFIASPIFDGDEKIGVLVFQFPIDQINAVMTSNQDWSAVGLGESGETYIVGNDFLLRNQSRFLIEDSENYFRLIEEIGTPLTTIARIRNLNSTIGLQEVKTDGTEAALSGLTGTDIFPDYRGVPVLSSYKPLNIRDANWVIMSEIDQEEAFSAIRSLAIRTSLAVAGLIVGIVVLATVFSRTITKPIEEVRDQALEIVQGKMDTEIGVDSKDEIGELAHVLNVMRMSNLTLIDELEDINQNLENLVEERTKELELSELRSRSIIESAGEGIVVIDRDSNIILWNQSAEKLFGYTAEEMIGISISRLIPERYESQHEGAMTRAIDSQKLAHPGVTHELAGKRKDGSEFPLELTLAVWSIAGETFVSGIIRDISERKEAEERIRTIVELAPDAVITIDAQQTVTLFNPTAERVFGYSADEVVGQSLTMLMPEKSRGIHGAEVEKFSKETSIGRNMDARREIKGRRKDGTVFPAEAGISKMVINGKDHFTTFFRDITDRKEAEAQLRVLSEALRSAANGVAIIDLEDKIQWVNPSFENMTGYSLDEIQGKSISILNSGKHPDEYYERIGQVTYSGDVWRGEIIQKRKDGSLYMEELSVTPILDESQKIENFVSIRQDITERKELERQLEIANERMSTELNFARDIQLDMLPLIFPAFPNRTEVVVHAALESAREVGGDFYDFYFLDDDHLCFVIGDVAGKGAPGALMMAVSKTLIKSRAADDSEPASILTHVNDELSQDNKSSMFVTVFLGIINVKTGELVYTNAGHNPPYIRRGDGSLQKVDAFHGPVIGAMSGLPYDQDRVSLQPGDAILLYTDGVTEAFNEQEQLFSESRLEKILVNKDLDSAESIVTGTIEEVNRFAGEAEQSDDITLLAVQHLGLPVEMKSKELRITIKNRYEDMGIVEEQFSEFVEENDLPDAVRQSMSIVLDEMLNNIISYAYQGEKEKDIEVNFELSGKRLVTTIKDSGVPFNPFARETPDVSESIEDREIGGLGIHMVRSLMDEYSYHRQINKNVVTLVKLIEE
jgi:PAS domain S-box-containing protein